MHHNYIFVYEQSVEIRTLYLVHNFEWINLDENVNKQQKNVKEDNKFMGNNVHVDEIMDILMSQRH